MRSACELPVPETPSPVDPQTMTAIDRKTPLHAWHVSHNARMAPFAGYEMPIQYQGIVAEHTATRTALGVFDISHMGRLRFDGPRADQLLDHLLTRRVIDMQPGMVRYSLVCNEEGGILDDVLVSCLESPSSKIYFLLVVNASNRDKIIRWLQPHLADFPDVEFHDVTDATAMIAVQGPKAIAVCGRLLPASALQLGYYRAKVTEQMSKPCVVSRTGYTGEDGFELIVRAEDAERVWENILLAGREHGAAAVGLGARDTLRLEAGMPLYGHELAEHIDPYTAGLAFACNLKDRRFIGSETLQQRASMTLPARRVGLTLEGRRPARENSPCFDRGNRPLGTVTSGTFSPTLQRPIAMAYLSSEAAVVGQTLDVDIRGTRATATVVELPFYRRPQ
jgi:aminomethyltransferase